MGEIGDFGPEGSIIFGVFVGLVSTSVQSLGLTLQRKSHILEEEKDISDVQRPPYRRRRWQLGMFMFIVSNIVGSTIQITTLPLPVLSTLQASGLVFNSICAALILHEPFTRYSLAGTVLVSGGAILIAIFGAIGEPAHDLSQLLLLFERGPFIGWVIVTAALVGAALGAARMLKGWRVMNSPRARLLRGMAYGFVSGILSAHSLLLAKSAVELVVRTIADGANQFNRWQSWMILLGLVGLALSQLYYLHRGLKLCSTSILYPFVFCIYNIIAILDGLIYFNQASRLSLGRGLLVLLGTGILLTGVICLSWRLNDDSARSALAPAPLDADLAYLSSETYLDSDASSIDSDTFPSIEESPLLTSHLTPSTLPLRPAVGTPELEYGTILPQRSVHWDASADVLKTPSATSLHRDPVSRLRTSARRQALAEADALWDELQEADTPLADLGDSTSSLTRGRTWSLQHATTSRMTPSPPSASPGGGGWRRAGHSPALGRAGTWSSTQPSGSGAAFSPGPLTRSGTGRTYRGRRASRAFSGGAAGDSSSSMPTGDVGRALDDVTRRVRSWWGEIRAFQSPRRGKARPDGVSNGDAADPSSSGGADGGGGASLGRPYRDEEHEGGSGSAV